MKKIKLFSLLAAMMLATSMWAADPMGCVDVVRGHDGSIYIEGWAYDPDNVNATLEIHVYMYKSGVADPVLGEGNTRANVSRPDVDNAFHCGANHGFSRYISTGSVPAGDYWINVFAINAAGTDGGNTMLHAAVPDTQVDFHFTLKSPLTISYNANGGSGAPAAQQKRYGLNINLQAKGSLARTGYTPDGWATSTGGNKAYNFGASYSGNASTTLYAHWTANQYTVTFDKQNGTGGSNSVTATYNANMPSATMPTRTGYTFKGYYDATSGGTLYYNANGSSARTWNKANAATLYARWKANKYTISYDLDGGEVALANPTEYTIETETFTLTNPTKEGYTFTGWTGSNGEEPQTEVTIAKGSTENKSYTANWIALKPCELGWLNVPEGGVVGTIGHEDEIVLPQVNASQDFILAFQAHTATLRLGSTDESVLAVYGFNNFAVIGVGECDVYVVHDEDAVFAYDSAAFHVTVNPEPEPAPTPTVWTALKVGDVIKVGDQLSPSVEWESANDYGVIKPDWAPYTLLRANIAQEHEWDDPVVTEAEDGAYYVFKFTHPTSGTCYLLANSAKSPLLAATATSDGLEVTNVGDDYGTPAFTFAVHENGSAPTAVENVQTNEVQASKLMENGVLYILHNGTMYNVQGTRVR